MMKTFAVAGAVALTLTAGLVGGCQRGENLTAAGKVAVEPVSTEQVRVVWAEVWQDGQDVVVTGRLRRRGPSPGALSGHVDVSFVDAEGKVVKRAASREVGMGRSAPGTGTRLTAFEVRVEFSPPEGGKAVVAYRAGRHRH